MKNYYTKISLTVFPLLTLFLSSCSVEMRPPKLPDVFEHSSSNNQELAIVKNFELTDILERQDEFIQISSWKDLSNYWLLQESGNESAAEDLLKNDYIQQSSDLSTEADDWIRYGKNINVSGDFSYVKKDDDIFFKIGRTLSRLKAYPAKDASIVSKIKFEDSILDFNIYSDFLYTVLKSNKPDVKEGFKVLVYDTSDPSKFSLLKEQSFEGSYMGTNFYGEQFYAFSKNDDFVHVIGERLLPKTSTRQCLRMSACQIPDIYAVDSQMSDSSLFTIHYLNMASEKKEFKRSVFILPKNSVISASNNNVYMSYPRHLSREFISDDIMYELLYEDLSQDDKKLANKISNTEEEILNHEEKRSKLKTIYKTHLASLDAEDRDMYLKEFDQSFLESLNQISAELEKTVIHKITLQNFSPKIIASGLINGFIPDNDHIIERGLNTSIASISGNELYLYSNTENRPFYNVMTLDNKLDLISSIMIPEIQNVSKHFKFIDNKFFFHTDKQREAFLVDISDAENHKYSGTLKLSDDTYFNFPLGSSKALVLETAKPETEIILSQIDYKNPSQLIVDQKLSITAEQIKTPLFENDKSFLYSWDKNVLILPLALNSPKLKIFGNQNFNGFIVFDLSGDKPKIKGLIDSINNQNQVYEGMILENDHIYIFDHEKITIVTFRGLRTLKELDNYINE